MQAEEVVELRRALMKDKRNWDAAGFCSLVKHVRFTQPTLPYQEIDT
jgi:hypothetical protein